MLKVLISVALIFAILGGCSPKTPVDPLPGDTPPTTRYISGPTNNDTTGAVITVLIDGSDLDGYIHAFEYRTSTEPVGGDHDPIVVGWKRTVNSRITITMPSPEALNHQTLELRAVDNRGLVDESPVIRTFYTLPTQRPVTQISSPPNDAELLALADVNTFFNGILLSFSASDPDGSIMEVAWSVDGGELQWIDPSISSFFVLPELFRQPLDGEHTLFVTCRDNSWRMDAAGDTVSFNLIVPTFEKDFLILDDTREDITILNVDDSVIDTFYSQVFGFNNGYSIEQRDLQAEGFPTLRELGEHKLIIWHGDDGDPGFYITQTNSADLIAKYLDVGGDLILGGTRMVDRWIPPPGPVNLLPPYPFVQGSFATEYLHISTFYLTGIVGQFSEANGVGDVMAVAVDPTKINPAFPSFGRVNQVVSSEVQDPWVNDLLLISAEIPEIVGAPCAISYNRDGYGIAFLGFPLYSLYEDDAIALAARLLLELGY